MNNDGVKEPKEFLLMLNGHLLNSLVQVIIISLGKISFFFREEMTI
jgi:hypothetical protein